MVIAERQSWQSQIECGMKWRALVATGAPHCDWSLQDWRSVTVCPRKINNMQAADIFNLRAQEHHLLPSVAHHALHFCILCQLAKQQHQQQLLRLALVLGLDFLLPSRMSSAASACEATGPSGATGAGCKLGDRLSMDGKQEASAMAAERPTPAASRRGVKKSSSRTSHGHHQHRT